MTQIKIDIYQKKEQLQNAILNPLFSKLSNFIQMKKEGIEA